MNKILVVFAIFLLLFSCTQSSENVKINTVNGKWDKKTVQKFNFEIKDAQNPKNIIFVVRNNNDYPYSNLRTFVRFENLKTKKKEIDTLNFVLAKPDGNWIGSGFGTTKEILFQYKLKYKFPNNGNYQIGITQAMRNDNLIGIEDIGIKIETAKP